MANQMLRSKKQASTVESEATCPANKNISTRLLWMKKPIHIITPKPGALGKKYLLSHLADHWRAWGHPVSIGPLPVLEQGIGLMHVDQTVVSPGYLPKVSAGSSLVNGNVLDISKSSFSSLRLLPDDRWDSPVIVKSNLNYFGNPEHPGLMAKAQRKLEQLTWRSGRRSWQREQRLPPNDYPVLENLSQVPDWVWAHKDIIVERFLPERAGDAYAIRGWLFFGERGYAYRLYSQSPVVKAGNITHFDILESVPEELQALRRLHDIDFGKFDYVEVEGRAVLIDLNKTPTTVGRKNSPRLLDLAEGLHDFPGMGN